MRKRCSRPYYYSAFGKKGLIRLVVSYLGALIPVLLISFVLSESTFGSLQSQARTAGEQRMSRAAENLSLFFSASRRNATQFSNTSALRPIALLQTSRTREQGVELLLGHIQGELTQPVHRTVPFLLVEGESVARLGGKP